MTRPAQRHELQLRKDGDSGATPILINRATSDMWWGITKTISVAAGLTDAKTVLAETSPACAAAVASVRPFQNSPQV